MNYPIRGGAVLELSKICVPAYLVERRHALRLKTTIMPENVVWIDKRFPGMEPIWFLGPEKRDTGTYSRHWGFAVRLFPGPAFSVHAFPLGLFICNDGSEW